MLSVRCIRSYSARGAEELCSMFMSRKAYAVRIGVAVVLAVALAASCTAAKKAVTASTGKVRVPANILSGSVVAKDRAFYAPKLPEDALAGIKLGRAAREVLAKWGNPSRITIGITQSQAAQQNAPVIPGIPYTPPQTNVFGGGLQSGIDQARSMLGMNQPLPGLPGMNPPGIAPPPGAEVAPTVQGGPSTIMSEEITWTYDLQNGITLEFIITDGLVTQITVGGQGPWALSKTRTGLQLGDTYKLVLWVCGYPENQRTVGRFLRASYVNKSRALYTFLNKKLVGVTIAMVPEQLEPGAH